DELDDWRLVASSGDRTGLATAEPSDPGRADLVRRQRELRERLDALAPAVPIYPGTFNPPGPTHPPRRRGPRQEGEPVPPSGVRTVGPPLEIAADAPERERRLATWIGHPENPLPARVMVNRVWLYHFGRGLVATPSDFGFQGGRPSHPELLDWLAREFLRSEGSLKRMHRLIVLSATYRQSSRFDARAVALDADNRPLWRFSPRRLEAETGRD